MFGEMKSGRNEQNYGDGPRSPHDAALSPPDLVIMAREVSFDSVHPSRVSLDLRRRALAHEH
jgi:hypothetical protein